MAPPRHQPRRAVAGEGVQGLRIDYVLCSPDLLPAVASCDILYKLAWRKWSDHAPLVVEFGDALRPPPTPRPPCKVDATAARTQRSSADGRRGGARARRRRVCRAEQRGRQPPPLCPGLRAAVQAWTDRLGRFTDRKQPSIASFFQPARTKRPRLEGGAPPALCAAGEAGAAEGGGGSAAEGAEEPPPSRQRLNAEAGASAPDPDPPE